MAFAVIFDLDGTLINSTSFVPVIAQKVAAEYGIKLSPSERSETTRYPFDVWVGNWNKSRGLSIDVKDVIRKYAAFERDFLKDQTILSSGVRALLEELHAHKVPMGIATSAPRERLNSILHTSSIRHFFGATVSVDDVKLRKPDPEPFLKVAHELKISPARCVGIEDTSTGLASVVRAGMKSVAYCPDPADAAELSHADRVISNFSELNFKTLEALFR